MRSHQRGIDIDDDLPTIAASGSAAQRATP
jgi:hypothetical protein